MFISSSKTRAAKKKLEDIRSEEGDGRKLLKDFLERELKVLTGKRDADAVIRESQKQESNVCKFAKLLLDEENMDNNMDLFMDAIEL